MKHLTKFVATLGIATMASASYADTNLTAETASPGGATHLSLAHMTEIAGTMGIANIQLADGQTLTNSIQNVAEGKTDIAKNICWITRATYEECSSAIDVIQKNVTS